MISVQEDRHLIQRSLFDSPVPPAEPHAPYVVGSATSREAAEEIKPHVNALQAQVLDFIRDQGDYGATDPEVCEQTGLRPDTARARRCELRDAGLVRDSAQRRLTDSGRQAVVWIASDSSAAGRVRP